jgi:hypothetical protein
MALEKLTIKITDRHGHLPVLSLISALRDTLSLLREINRSINQRPVDWFVDAVRMRSPFCATIAGEAQEQVVKPMLNGLREMDQRAVRPAHYNATALELIKRLVGLYSDGVASIELGATGERPVKLTYRLAGNTDDILTGEIAAQRQPYSVKTELEGRLESISAHGVKPSFCIYDPITDKPIECDFDESELPHVADLIKTKARVRVAGTALYGADDSPQSIQVAQGGITTFPDDSQLPSIRDLHAAGIDITGGQDSVLYVRGLRDAE